ncbi:MAG TPA: hypothetical protein VLJ14_12540 [Ktedonobacterales bacterium]|jgi:hypothetical protein|nr:hypothetical protein [Ktedonobacterales bacterium]
MQRDDSYGPAGADGASEQPAPAGDPALDITRMRTIRLISPEIAERIGRQRARLARDHRAQADRLRQLAGEGMDDFEQASDAVMRQLREWLTLQRHERTLPEEQRFSLLTRELMEREIALSRQWDVLAGMLHEASDHEISAHVLFPANDQP